MIDFWFPTSIFIKDNLIPPSDNIRLKDYCLGIESKIPSGGLDWVGGTYTTHGSHESNSDSEISSLIKIITRYVDSFAETYGCNGKYNNSSTWLNVSGKGQWQEFHSHPNSIFSAVYYVSAPEGSGKIIFEDPREPDMFPLKNVTERNVMSHTRIPYAAEEGRLIIFRSYLRHMVEPGTNIEPRISFALNFK